MGRLISFTEKLGLKTKGLAMSLEFAKYMRGELGDKKFYELITGLDVWGDDILEEYLIKFIKDYEREI